MATNDSPLSVAPSRSLVLELGQGGGQVTVTGEGFGPAPNVVLFRRYREGQDGQALTLPAPEGEVGTLASGAYPSVYKAQPDGSTALSSYDGVSALQGTPTIDFAPTREFRLGKSEMVPDGFYFPGSSAVQSFPSVSSCKFDWMLFDPTANNDSTKADICIPTYGGSGKWDCSGNASNPNGSANLGNIEDYWDWGGWNTLSWYQREGSPDQVVNAGEQQWIVSSAKTSIPKDSGTVIQSFANPIHGAATAVEPGKDTFSRLTMWSYHLLDGGSQTRLVRRNHYLATGPNSKQCILLGNSPSLSGCTETCHIAHDTWQDDSVAFTPDDFERSKFTHYHIIKPNGSIVSGAI